MPSEWVISYDMNEEGKRPIEVEDEEIGASQASFGEECPRCGAPDGDHADDCPSNEWASVARLTRKEPRAEKKPISVASNEVYDDDWEHMEGSDEEEEEEGVIMPRTLDLRWFFGVYNVSPLDQIAVCRTHANNLAALSRVDRGAHTGAKSVGKPAPEPHNAKSKTAKK